MRRIRSWPACLPPAAGGFCFAVIGLAGLWPGSGVGKVLFYVLVTLAGCWMSWRALRGGILIRADGVEICGELRTRFVPWHEVDGFFVGANWSAIPWSRLYLRTTNGDVIVAPYVASVGPLGPRLENLSTELNALRPRCL